MKIAHIYAYVNGNLGDDLFVDILCRRYQNVKFILIGPRGNETSLKHIKNLIYIPEDLLLFKVLNKVYVTILKLRKESRQNNRYIFSLNLVSHLCKVNIAIIGSAFIQFRDWRLKLNAQWFERKPYFIGCNFGPYESQEFFDTYENLFKKASQISFRDEYSYNLFKHIKNVSYSSDIIFSLQDKKEEKNDGYYLVSLIDLDKDNNLGDKTIKSVYEEKCAEILKYLIGQKKEIVFLSFCDNQGDNLVIKRIMDNILSRDHDLIKNKVKYFSYNEIGMEKTLELIKNCDSIISSRFHGTILGFLYKKRVLPIIYSEKMTNVLNDLGFSGNYITIENIKEISLETIESQFLKMDENDRIKNVLSANEHFKLLDRVLR